MTPETHAKLIDLVDSQPEAKALRGDVRRAIKYTRMVDADSYRSGAWEAVAILVEQTSLPESLRHSKYPTLLGPLELSCFQAGWAIKVARGLKYGLFTVNDESCLCLECRP